MKITALPKHVLQHLVFGAASVLFFFVDLWFPLGVAAGVPYITVVLATLSTRRPSTVFAWSIVCTLLVMVGFFMSAYEGQLWKATINRGLAIYAIWAVALTWILLFERTNKQLQAQSEQQLVEVRKTLEQVSSLASDAVVITDTKGITTWVNEGFTRLTGYSFEEAVGGKPGDLLQGKDTDLSAIAQLSEAVREAKELSIEILNYHKNGTAYWVELTLQPVFEQQKLTKFIAVERDITARKRLPTSDQTQTATMVATPTPQGSPAESPQFLSKMLGQLDPPIDRVITGSQQILDLSHSDHHRDISQRLYHSGLAIQTITSTTNALLGVNNSSKDTAIEFSASGFAEHLQKISSHLFASTGSSLVLDNQYPEKTKLIAVREMLNVVCYYLLIESMQRTQNELVRFAIRPATTSANRHTSSSQTPYKRSSKLSNHNKPNHDDIMQIEISYQHQKAAIRNASDDDNGSSHSDYQLLESTIVAQGGRLQISHPSPSDISVVVEYPVTVKQTQPAEPETAVASPTTEAAHSDKRILIAEDNRVNVMVLTKMLKSIGFTNLDLAKNGQEAVELAKTNRYYAILMDNHMPVMTGIEATKQIIGEHAPDANIIACTADTAAQAREDFLSSGAVMVMYKPINKDKLAEALGIAHSEQAGKGNVVGANLAS